MVCLGLAYLMCGAYQSIYAEGLAQSERCDVLNGWDLGYGEMCSIDMVRNEAV
jgi:hypothetical protein